MPISSAKQQIMKTVSFLVFEDYKNMETWETKVNKNLEVSTTFSGFSLFSIKYQ